MKGSGPAQKPSSGKAAKPYAKPDRAPRACLRCKAQKIRCDGHSQPNGQCSPCAANLEDCKYVDSMGYLNYTQRKYIQSLEDRIQKLEALLERLHPGESFPELDAKSPERSESTVNVTQTYVDDTSFVQRSTVTHMLVDRRFYGTYSDPVFIRVVIEDKLKETGKQWGDLVNGLKNRMSRRGTGNHLPSWQKQILTSEVTHKLTFPPETLMASLIDLYFTFYHLYRPILHRPTFEKMVRARVHERDQYFGALVLMVCACGARWSDDPRTRQSADDKDSAGWLYFEQVHRLPRPISEPVSLVRLQMYNLMLIFLDGVHLVSLDWSLVGMGMRLALDVGAHLNSTFTHVSQSERELWKRAFWGLFVTDQLIGHGLGRKGIISPEDIDLDLPLEVDDEYWYPADNGTPFVQPNDKPSVVAGFNGLIRLMCLMSKLAQFIRGPVTPISPLEAEAQTEEILDDAVALNSEFNLWLGSLPPHLQWDPNQSHPIYFAQSAMLNSFYHKCIISIHRPFVSIADNLGDPANRTTSFVLCTNAARACSRVLHTFAGRVRKGSAPWFFYSALVTNVILLLDVWTGGTEDAVQASKECVESLAICEEQYAIARVFRDMFLELFSMTGIRASPSPGLSSKALGPVEHPNLLAMQTLTAELANITSLSGHPLLFDLPASTFSTDFQMLDSVPLGLDIETAMLQDWTNTGGGFGGDLWSFLS